MSHSKAHLLPKALGVLLIGGLACLQADEKKDRQEKPPVQRKAQPQQVRPGQPQQGQQRPGQERRVQSPAGQEHQNQNRPAQPQPDTVRPQPDNQSQSQQRPGRETQDAQTHPRENKQSNQGPPPVQPARPQFKLTDVKKPGGETVRVSPSNKVRERTLIDEKTGMQKTQVIGAAGRVEAEEVRRRDGSKQVTQYDLGREKRVQVAHKDGTTEITDVHYNRNGEQRARETIVKDPGGRVVSKTVVVKQNLVIRNTTVVNNTTVVRNYHPGRFGFVYRPMFVAPVVFVSWYDPFWYTPVGVPIYHPFRYSWGWYEEPWYRYNAYYWHPYPVYPAPCYWVTDWMVAAYVADRYAVATSVAQTQEEIRLAREDAEKARKAAEEARDAAEIAEAKAAQAAAEARAERAEARAARAERDEARRKEVAGKPNPNAGAIDEKTKEALKDQVEKTIAEKKAFADQSAKGANPVPPDVSAALADPKHIYPVSKTISVTRSEDSKPAGTLTAGDLLKVEPGQESALANATENTPINMRVITSKGEDDSVPAGTVVAVPLKELQEFDNEFRAKLDLGLAEADKNKDLFKKEAQN